MKKNDKDIIKFVNCIFKVCLCFIIAQILIYPSMAFAYEEDLWPIWPVETYIPEPPKMNLLYYDDENPVYEVVVDGLSTEPISFFAIGRSAMAWVDRVPKIELGDTLPEEAWGAVIEVMDIDSSNELKKPSFASDISYFTKVKKSDNGYLYSLDEQTSDIEDALEFNSVLKAYSENWYDHNNDGFPEIANQYFPSDYITRWQEFLEKNYKYNEYIGDTGHSSPLLVWPDNIWLAPMENWLSYMEETLSPDYGNYGGKIMYNTGNEGVVRAFDTDPDDDGNLSQIFAFLPPSSFMFSIYHQNIREVENINGAFVNPDPAFPRLITLDGPIAVHDVETSEGNWNRLLVGTMGQGTYLDYKPYQAWDLETKIEGVISDDVPDGLANGHAWGAYAIDITDVDNPQLEWSISNSYWKNNGVLWVNGDKFNYSEDNPGGYSAFKNIEMTPTRPVFGYTEENGNRNWHLLLLGIDKDNYFHVYDIDPNDGSIRSHYQLQDQPWNLTAEKDGRVYPDDVFRPSRIAAALAWGERTPLLTNVYLYLSNGALYDWNLQEGSSPRKLLHLYGKQGDAHSQPLQDFDVTYLEEIQDDGSIEIHRYLAAVCGFPKNGNPSNVIETEHFALVTIDLTELEEDYIDNLPQTVETATFFGRTNEYVYPAPYLQFSYLALTSPNEDEEELEGAQGPHWNTAYPASSPVFYNGKIILVSRGFITQGKPSNRDAWSRVYVLDPLGQEEIVKFDTKGVTHLGGALIDENAILYSPTTGGVLSEDLSGYVDPLGEQGVSPTPITTNISSLYWRVNN
jgi:hypothetical protein